MIVRSCPFVVGWIIGEAGAILPDAQRILVVEDDHDVADMVEVFLTIQGYAFHHASDGEDALDLAPRVLPHVILMDLALPDMTGYGVMAGLRSNPRTAHIPIIFISKWSSRDKRLISLALGAEAYLAKPFDLEELLLRVQNSIARTARDVFTDLRTGLPAAFTARAVLDNARTNPGRAIIEVTLEHTHAYFDVYGSAAWAEVHQMLGHLLVDTVNREAHLDDFIGYLDENQFVIVTAAAHAEAIVARLEQTFQDKLARHYSADDWRDQAMVWGGEVYPLMRLACRVTVGLDP